MAKGRVLLTSATGDTGRATLEQLLARGRSVRAFAHQEDDRSRHLQAPAPKRSSSISSISTASAGQWEELRGLASAIQSVPG